MVKCRQHAGFLARRAAGWGLGVGVFHYLLPTFQQHLEEEWGEGGGKSECEGEVKEEAVNRNAAEIS